MPPIPKLTACVETPVGSLKPVALKIKALFEKPATHKPVDFALQAQAFAGLGSHVLQNRPTAPQPTESKGLNTSMASFFYLQA